MDDVPDFVCRYQEISSEELGGKILFATDDFFAAAENLLKRDEPLWNEEYTEFGKWMDGWETRRKRIPGHDWAIIELGRPSTVRGVCIDTAYFTGNYAPIFSLQAAYLNSGIEQIQNRNNKIGTAATQEDLEKVSKLHSEDWKTLIPMTRLRSGIAKSRKHYFELAEPNDHDNKKYSHLRLNIYPDGGVARLRVYGSENQYLSGKCLEFSDAHYGHPDNLLKPWPSKGMHDGWETARRLDRPCQIELDDFGFMMSRGEEWAILKLEKTVIIDRLEIDTTHFKGNCPDSVKIEGSFGEPGEDIKSLNWHTILPRTKLMPNRSNGLREAYNGNIEYPVNHVKVILAPDGGIARIRIYGRGE